MNAYFQSYPGYYDTCDAGIRDEFGYIHILAREDDVINVAGHRLSTSALEEVVLKVRRKALLYRHVMSSFFRSIRVEYISNVSSFSLKFSWRMIIQLSFSQKREVIL